MTPRQLVLRSFAMLILTLFTASACVSQTVIETSQEPEPAARAVAGGEAISKASPKRAVVDSAPVDDKTARPDLVIVLDERTDQDDELEDPTIGLDIGPVLAETTRGGRDADDGDDGAAEAGFIDGDDGAAEAGFDADSDQADESDESEDDVVVDSDDPDQADESADDVVAEEEPPRDPELTDEAIDLTESSTETDCRIETLEPWDGIHTIGAHPTVDGVLVAPCVGATDERLLYAWQVLATITPQEYLKDIGLFSGFNSTEGNNQTTLAFAVPPVGEDGTFQISVNLAYFENNRYGLFLTMAHEVAHVVTVGTSQLEEDVDDLDCRTYADRHGCYVEDALMHDWVTRFWGNGLLEGYLAPDHDGPHHHGSRGDRVSGEDRCALNAGFLGPYAANHPEEDFAETFSAFVFDVAVETPELQAKLDWFEEQPDLVEFRDRIEDAGFPALENNFASCG